MIKKIWNLFFLAMGLILVVIVSLDASAKDSSVAASPNSYTLEYAKISPITQVPLGNATLIIKYYLSGTPHGFTTVATDKNNSFNLTVPYNPLATVKVFHIVGEHKFHAICQGVSGKGKNLILIFCRRATGSVPDNY